ncbi:hypothetical protein VE03_09144 [Pseudogymnoascus sp. 23342-1-I1]|nr:hypothetical protein VE03_09144 [Pseudogymnoascus sp. 23342-1-I1]
MSQQYQYSKEVDPATLARSRSFTTLPVRIHKNDHHAQKASHQFSKEWKRFAKANKFDVNFSQSPMGHFASLVLPECLPERLAFAAKAFDFITAVDDATDLPDSLEEKSTPRPEIKTRRRTRVPQSDDWTSNPKYKKIKARFLLEGIESCGKGLMSMLGSVESFLESNAIYSRECKSLEDYLPLHIVNVGAT